MATGKDRTLCMINGDTEEGRAGEGELSVLEEAGSAEQSRVSQEKE